MTVRLCANNHEVREGMFVCPTCGSDDVVEREPGRPGGADRSPTVGRREQAEERLTGFLRTGVLLLVLGVVGVLISIAMAAGGSVAGYGFFALVAWGFGVAGAAYLLCGIVGWA